MKYKLISDELIAMRDLDLQVRQSLLESGELNKGYHEQMEAIHLKNANRLNEIIQEIGYPNNEKVGKPASEAAWLIIQHAISLPEFMKACLKLAEVESQNGNISPVNVAFLKDRISMFENRPQSFGTQFEFDEKGNFQPYKLDESIEIINKRRESLGLNSVEERLDELKRENDQYMLAKKTLSEIRQEKLEFEQWKLSTGWIKAISD